MKIDLKNIAVCTAFWVCLGLIALKATDSVTCTAHEEPLAKLLLEKLWPR